MAALKALSVNPFSIFLLRKDNFSLFKNTLLMLIYLL